MQREIFHQRSWVAIGATYEGTVLLAEWRRGEPAPSLAKEKDWVAGCRLLLDSNTEPGEQVMGALVQGPDSSGQMRMMAFVDPHSRLLCPCQNCVGVLDP